MLSRFSIPRTTSRSSSPAASEIDPFHAMLLRNLPRTRSSPSGVKWMSPSGRSTRRRWCPPDRSQTLTSAVPTSFGGNDGRSSTRSSMSLKRGSSTCRADRCCSPTVPSSSAVAAAKTMLNAADTSGELPTVKGCPTKPAFVLGVTCTTNRSTSSAAIPCRSISCTVASSAGWLARQVGQGLITASAKNASPRASVMRSVCGSFPHCARKPKRPPIGSVGPPNPVAASSAEKTALRDERAIGSLNASVLSLMLSIVPPSWLMAMPSARRWPSASRPRRIPAVAVPPKTLIVPVLSPPP